MTDKPRLAISTCLTGENVRYDGGHKHDPYLTRTLGAFVDYLPVCPEVECGLPVPREAMRLVGEVDAPRLVTIRTKQDITPQMEAWAEKRLTELQGEDLSGYIFKSRSPSSGMARVKVYNEKGQPVPRGVGIWARMFMDRFPLVPVEDEGRLHDPVLRENFIERVFAYRRWQGLVAKGKTRGALVDFHTRHKMTLMSHDLPAYRELGRLVAEAKKHDPEKLFAQYIALFMEAMKKRATPRKNVNVMQHIMGHFKKELAGPEKEELLDLLERYKRGELPLIAPMTLINHYVKKYDKPYLADQMYLNPHPMELGLRNHA